MFVEKFMNNGVPYLRLVKSIRIENSSGKKVSQKKVVLNIGPLSRFDDGKPDYVQRLKDSFKNGQPLIGVLKEYVEQEKPLPKKHNIVFADGDAACIGAPKLAAPLLLDRLFQQLGLDKLCATLKHSLKLEYDLSGLLKLLLFGRLMQPASKWNTVHQNEDYIVPLADISYPYHIYDVLDILAEHKEQFIRRMHSSICKSVGRSVAHIYYDVTNFFFEIQEPDEMEDIDGNCVKGLRQKGVSKENRREPIVQMGLFLDEDGIPITIESFPGNTLDQATLRPALKKSLNLLDMERFVLVADRGMHSNLNICRLVEDGQGYIVSKSIQKTSADERKWILDQEGYVKKSPSYRIKSRIIDRIAKDENGNTVTLKQKVVVYWSKKFYDKEYHEHKSFLDFMEKLRDNPASFRITATQGRQIKKYFKSEFVHKKTGEIVDGKQLLGMLDEAKLEKLTKYMGYYQIVTSETELSDDDIVEAYHGLTRIEDQFREMKGTLETRPMYVSTRQHIQAHLLVCLMALTMLRMIQKQIMHSNDKKANDRLWSYGLSGHRIQKALNNWLVERLPGDLYRFSNTNNADIEQILKAFSATIEPKLYSRGELKKLKSRIKS